MHTQLPNRSTCRTCCFAFAQDDSLFPQGPAGWRLNQDGTQLGSATFSSAARSSWGSDIRVRWPQLHHAPRRLSRASIGILLRPNVGWIAPPVAQRVSAQAVLIVRSGAGASNNAEPQQCTAPRRLVRARPQTTRQGPSRPLPHLRLGSLLSQPRPISGEQQLAIRRLGVTVLTYFFQVYTRRLLPHQQTFIHINFLVKFQVHFRRVGRLFLCLTG